MITFQKVFNTVFQCAGTGGIFLGLAALKTTELAVAGIFGAIFAGDLAIWYGTRLVGEAFQMREWKVRIIQGSLILLYGGALAAVFIGTGVITGGAVGPVMGGIVIVSLIFGGYLITRGVIQSQTDPNKRVEHALPEKWYHLLFIFNPHSDFERSNGSLSPTRRALGYCYLHYMKEAKKQLLKGKSGAIRKFSAEEIEEMGESIYAVNRLALYHMIQKSRPSGRGNKLGLSYGFRSFALPLSEDDWNPGEKMVLLKRKIDALSQERGYLLTLRLTEEKIKVTKKDETNPLSEPKEEEVTIELRDDELKNIFSEIHALVEEIFLRKINNQGIPTASEFKAVFSSE